MNLHLSRSVSLRWAALLAIALPTALGSGCSSQPHAAMTLFESLELADGSKAHRFGGLSGFHRKVATQVPSAQEWFDQGLVLTYAFNHDEAVRSFRAAQQLDPDCAMAFWGEAYARGPNINLPMDDAEVAQKAHQAAQRAFALRQHETAANRALIEALVSRYEESAPTERKHLDQAYADAMRAAVQRFPDDSDISALFAESLLDVNPWHTWDKQGKPLENTLEVQHALESVLARDEAHPLANHLYIHAMEASPWPEKAESAADRLGSMFPGAGHLVHMPAHIYINVGRYHDAEACNHQAIAVDRAYFGHVGPQGIYEFYRAHNHHFIVYAAMFGGRREAALQSARDLVADFPQQLIDAMPTAVDGFLVVPLHAMLRFGRWDDVLAEPKPEARFPLACTMWHYARGIALAAKGDTDAARTEQQQFLALQKEVSPDALFGINPAPPVLVVAQHMLAGEILYRQGQFDEAFAQLQQAVDCEDGLRYDEPSPWMQPVRHALGALLLEQGKVEQAAQAYREDLKRHPENGWSLSGLAACQQQLGEADAADELLARSARAFRSSDVTLAASCYCSQSAGAAPVAGSPGK